MGSADGSPKSGKEESKSDRKDAYADSSPDVQNIKFDVVGGSIGGVAQGKGNAAKGSVTANDVDGLFSLGGAN